MVSHKLHHADGVTIEKISAATFLSLAEPIKRIAGVEFAASPLIKQTGRDGGMGRVFTITAVGRKRLAEQA